MIAKGVLLNTEAQRDLARRQPLLSHGREQPHSFKPGLKTKRCKSSYCRLAIHAPNMASWRFFGNIGLESINCFGISGYTDK
jgi:hypothetical protein